MGIDLRPDGAVGQQTVGRARVGRFAPQLGLWRLAVRGAHGHGSADQEGSEVIYVGQRRPGHNLVVELVEEAAAVMP